MTWSLSGPEPASRVDDHGRVESGIEGTRCDRDRGNGRQRWKPSGPRDRSRRADSPLRHHAAGCRRTRVYLTHASPCRPCRRDSVLRGRRLWRNDVHLLVVGGGHTTRPNQDRHRPHHCVPSRIGACDSACDCHLHITRCAEWSSREGQTGTRKGPSFGHGDIR